MNGGKVLIKGNHDTLKMSQYEQYFKDIRGSHQLAGILMTHIPVHPESLARWGFNVHGHLHSYKVMLGKVEDKRYLNVSMEQINYTPISLEDVRKIKLERGIE
jgi:calcineurin-like phosphoesterase family protein